MTLTEILDAVSAFVTTYAVYISAGLVLGLGAFIVTRVLRAGR